MILQFEVKNTLNDQLLEQVNVSLEDAEVRNRLMTN